MHAMRRISLITGSTVALTCLVCVTPARSQGDPFAGPNPNRPANPFQGEAEADNSPKIAVYNVGDLIAKPADLRYDSGRWPGTGRLRTNSNSIDTLQNNSMQGGMGGPSGGLGGGSGGMFQVPDRLPSHISPQFGGEGMGGMGGGMGGMGGMGTMGSSYVPPAQTGGSGSRTQYGLDPNLFSQLITAILSIDPESWEEMGGVCTIRPFADTLVIFAHPPMHQKIQSLLDTLRAQTGIHRTLTIDFVITGEDQISDIEDQQLMESAIVSGTLASVNRQVATVTAGEQQNYVVGATPIASTTIGYQPVSIHPMMGWLLEFEPSLDLNGDGKQAKIDVTAEFTRATEGSQTIMVTDQLSLDRLSIAATSLSGTVVGPAGQWHEVASLQNEATDNTVGSLHMYVRWK
jgi:hypothetical protein